MSRMLIYAARVDQRSLFDQCPVDSGARTMPVRMPTWHCRCAGYSPQLETYELTKLSKAWNSSRRCAGRNGSGRDSDRPAVVGSLKQSFQAGRERVEKQIYQAAGWNSNINSNPQLREILLEN